jgi:TATA-box binding protein (TBP) (component of TFIID and TFIIIB)
MNVDDEWLAFLEDDIDGTILSSPKQNNTVKKNIISNDDMVYQVDNLEISKNKSINVVPSELYISTKTKIIYLNQKIDLNETFWKIPVMHYGTRSNCVIKKQIKLQSFSNEELCKILHYVSQHQMQGLFIEQINLHNSTALLNNTNFKDVRKISIGLCRKDILSQRSKKKSAFYNCFVLILRIFHQSKYKDVHVKIFNTGKMEIPGMQSDELFELVQQEILSILQPYNDNKLEFILDKCETVLINSNFYTGYNINRDKLFNILKYDYKINATYDPCSYPGIQCKYNKSLSFMIFRTGSVLIVGKSSDKELFEVYEMLKKILIEKYEDICENYDIPIIDHKNVIKEMKIKKRIIYM